MFFFALFSYSFHSSSKLVNYFKFIIFPALFFEAIIVNKTVSYSIQPLLVTAVFLGSQTLLQIPKILHVILQDNFKINKVFVTCILLLTVSGENIQNIFVEYNHYGHLTKRMKERKIPNLSPYRLLDITNRIKHNSVATYSEYPFLFLSQENYSVKYPYVEDLAAPGNLGREKMWIDQLTKLKKFPPNILVDKTSASFLSKWTDLGKVTVENYIEIYHLTRDGDERRYSERIHISKAHFNKTYVATGNDYLVKNNSILTNPYNSSIIAKITSQKDRCVTNTTIKTSVSSITHNENTYNNKEVYSFILPNNQILISNPNINCEKYKVQLYSQ